MRYRYFVPALVLLAHAAGARAVEPSDLKPGLITTHGDSFGNGPEPRIWRLEPTVALTLGENDRPHPKLAKAPMSRWLGHINITRAGKYKFSVAGQNCTFALFVDDKLVLTAGNLEPNGPDVVKELDLDGGVHAFAATVAGVPGKPIRVEVFWQGPGFVKEPLNHQFLGHLPKDRPKEFDRDGQLEHGRFKFEELSCAKCHKPAADDRMAKTLVEHTGPNLTEVAKRAYPGWIYAWLADPAKLRPHTTMPNAFTDDATGAAERYAVTQYLVSLSGKPLEVYKLPTVPPDNVKQSMEKGRVLYHVTGCAACHNDPIARKKKDEEEEKEPLAPSDYLYGQHTLAGPVAKYALGSLGSKFRPETLAAYLQNPLKTNPHGRMPQMNLSGQEATDIARYLCRTQEGVSPDKVPIPPVDAVDVAAAVGPQFKKQIAGLRGDAQWVELGKLLTGAKGCLDAKPDAAKVPVYKLDAKERDALAAFLKDGLSGAGSPAPAYQARVALKRFNCLNCHQRDGEGGIPVELADQMRLLEKSENADDVRPPVLTGVGHKTRTSWLKQILTQSGRARPWMQLRMPQYGEGNVGFLPDAVAYLEGTTPDDKVHVVERTPAKVAAGRTIVGKGGLGCISCHDIGGVANTGTRGPDLSTINQRVRYEWYERWLSQPLRMAPGTRMPQAFVDGKSTLKTVLGGDPHGQAEAMWAYLALGPGLPLPDGLEPPKGLVIAVKDRPEILRTFMPDAGAKAVAVGYPGYVSVAFSADQCRTAYAWAGNFLDASPVWNNRGGAPAKLLGQKFWTAPPGHPWALTADAKSPPDFLARATNPAFGLPLPLDPPRVYDGPMAVRFDGYGLDKDGKPTFRYRTSEKGLDDDARGAELVIAETPSPLKSLLATGLARKFEVTIPAEERAWFFAGATTKDPRAYATTGKPLTLDLKADEVKVSAAGTRVVLPDGDRAVMVEAAGAPAGAEWRFVRHKGGAWLAVLKLPVAKAEQKLAFTLNTYALPKDDEGLIKELVGP